MTVEVDVNVVGACFHSSGTSMPAVLHCHDIRIIVERLIVENVLIQPVPCYQKKRNFKNLVNKE